MDALAFRFVMVAALWAWATASVAAAHPVSEVRLGVTQHNICVTDCNNANKEEGPNISGEIVFTSPGLLKPIGRPRPYLNGSVNLGGDTSFAAAGLLWTFPVARGWSIEPGLGYAIHDGELNPPFPNGDPRNAPFDRSKIYLGSRDLFRTSLAINKDLGPRWGLQVQYEHLSHGQIIGNGRNQGLDNIGVRVRYRF